jgi:hypothetical protein
MMKIEERVATASDVIAHLSKMPPDSPVYFDCPHCGRANGFHHIGIAIMVTTRDIQEPRPLPRR